MYFFHFSLKMEDKLDITNSYGKLGAKKLSSKKELSLSLDTSFEISVFLS